MAELSVVKTGTLHGATYQYWAEEGTSLELSFIDEGHVRESWWKIKPGDVVLDIGAAFGSYMIPALALGGYVHAWNPEEYDTGILLKNLELNGFTEPERYRIHRLCAYGQSGYLSAKEDQSFSVDKQEGMWQCMSIDQFVADYELRRVDWIKMDIEGSEVDAIRGATETLKFFKPRLIIENHLFKRGTIADEIEEIIQTLDLGYVSETVPYHAISHSFYTCDPDECGVSLRPTGLADYVATENMVPGVNDDIHVLGMSKVTDIKKACKILRDIHKTLKPFGHMEFYLDCRSLDMFDLVISMRDMGYVGVQCLPFENPRWVVRVRASKGF